MTHRHLLRSYIHLVHCEHNFPSLRLVKIATEIATLCSYGGKKALGDVTASVSDSLNMCGSVAWTYKGSLDFSLHQNRLL